MVLRRLFPEEGQKDMGLEPFTRCSRGNQMITNDKDRKPFHVGQLVRWLPGEESDGGLDIVLKLQWHMAYERWLVYTLDQRTGIKQWCRAEDFEPVGENDVKESK